MTFNSMVLVKCRATIKTTKIANTNKMVRIVFSYLSPYPIKSFKVLLRGNMSIRYYKNFLQAGFISIEPKTGFIRAWVGGINHKFFKYDHVKQGKRQPGSTFKPIVYAAAIDNGYSPFYPVVDAPVVFELPGQDPPYWRPDNHNSKWTGETMTLRKAMAKSVNSITAFMTKKLSPTTVVNYAKNFVYFN